ncbi:MAG TPA: FprA family A-type flavoprotein [Bacteroidales bacterium]|nr:FprA family A-type flavoprotein [Bacteroidales bacterium]
MTDNKVLKVIEDVSWVGVLDRDLVTFDIVMETREGTTYNSYFINAEKKVVIDTVKETFHEIYMDKIRSVVNPSEIDYIVVTHTEPDHSGSLKYLLQEAPNAVVYGSRQAINYLQDMIDRPFKFVFVKDGDVLDLGNKKLTFISAPNLHWPDTMYAWLNEDRLLFTCDSFGAHFCREEMFDDLTGPYDESFKYYFDVILKPFSNFMVKALEKIKPLDIRMICPGHGPILRSTWQEKVKITGKYAEQYIADSLCLDNSILITYVSAYGYTKQMADAIAEGIKEVVDYTVRVVDIENILLGDLEELIVKSKSILVGSPTINQNTLLPVYRLFAMINPLRDKGKKAAAFGSYGWSGEAVKLIENQLRALKLNVVLEGISSKFSANEEKHRSMVEFGRTFAGLLKEQVQAS